MAKPDLPIPDDFPRFIVTGHQDLMETMRELFWLHYQPAGPMIPLWDEWLPMSTLWPAREAGPELRAMRRKWAEALASRIFTDEGYVQTQQHDGPAHAEGWPFPLWQQAGGIGWHFAGTGVAGYDAPRATPEGWQLTGAQGEAVNERGWPIELGAAGATASPPAFAIEAKASPYLRLNWWAEDLDGADGYVEWTTPEHPEFGPERRAYFSPAVRQAVAWLPMGGEGGRTVADAAAETRTMIRMHHLRGWHGMITGLRIAFANRGPARIVIKSLHTACDTRHNVNNLNFIRGCHDYFAWTRDIAFLRGQMPRLRMALRFVQNEFDTRRRKCVYTTWPGHEGRSGVRYVRGKKVVIRNEGIGSNYWDLLPFGGRDALASIYYFDALGKFADLEEQVAGHPEWNIRAGSEAFDPIELRRHARQVRDYGGKRFWNDATGRFGTVDLDGRLHDYGFTFLNNEAVYYGFATTEQARAIHDWLDGRRVIPGDTSSGPDIYHWRFGPRSTTKRNLDYYFWAYCNPESIPWGNQVQDGGAVLGFSYHDLMARLRTAGPDDAWRRLREILAWFTETQAAGGYRKYYKDPARGTMQGGNVPGGLGLDMEFFESVMVPQVMIYGFLGLRPTADGLELSPRLPAEWPDLAITRIHFQEHVLDIRVAEGTIEITDHTPNAAALRVRHGPEWKVTVNAAAQSPAESAPT
jgi:hypothetical protein